LLCRFLANHRAVQAELHFSDAFIDIASEGFDLAIRVGQLADTDLIGHHICRIRRLICASPAYLAQAGWPQRITDLAGHRGI
ncbi:LysR substrate-binding domain-containing protein, partial [Streptomyces galilaeus]|uniref:LysR substrate-binding domain-containing protein n=1 Tax=Streptomyces galilaeus TaxID=33899 RepID=UPI0038F5D1BD